MKKLHEIEKNIENLYSKVKNCTNIKDACKYINQLIEINEHLTKIIFIENIKVNERLWKFFKDFDVSYESNMCEFFFKKIKNNEYEF